MGSIFLVNMRNTSGMMYCSSGAKSLQPVKSNPLLMLFTPSFSLKYRFELNLKDVGFVVESLLPSLKDKLFEEVNIELLTARLKENQKAKGNKEEIKKSKHLLWNDIKINSFVRTISAVYLVNLVAVLTCTQLSLLGRLSYLESVFAIKEKNNSVESHGKPADFISEQEERHYLTLSWYLMNVGWKKCIERVKDAVEVVVGGYMWPYRCL